MIAIDNVLISNEIISEDFACNLSACKGACCWEGDYGAPVNADEQKAISESMPAIKQYLSIESIQLIEKDSGFTHYKEPGFTGTALHPDGACVFMTFGKYGVAECAVEKISKHNSNSNIKPLSCHLYPIRVSSNPKMGFEAWNYDKWEICRPACSNGKRSKIKIYEFLKTAIIRAKGISFYNQLAAAAEHLKKKQ